jgi:hypothetical protein
VSGFPAADTVAASTAGVERMRIDSSGNVGIGVSTIDTALGTKLHVAGTIRTDTGSASANPGIVFDHDNFADADANSIVLDRTSEAMLFTVNASERMRIDSSGKVGIGTSSPYGQLTLSSGVLVAFTLLMAHLLAPATDTLRFSTTMDYAFKHVLMQMCLFLMITL